MPVGAIEILSGPSAAYGKAIKEGLDLALDEINQKGVLGGRKINLIVEDSAGNKDQAINAARKLIGRDNVALIIGPTLSNEMFAVGPVVNERKIPIIGTSTTAVGITDIGPYVFRTSLPEATWSRSPRGGQGARRQDHRADVRERRRVQQIRLRHDEGRRARRPG